MMQVCANIFNEHLTEAKPGISSGELLHWSIVTSSMEKTNQTLSSGTSVPVWRQMLLSTFNSVILSHLLLHFEEVDDEEKAAITRQVSPVAWQNINLSGAYQFASNPKLPDLQEITWTLSGAYFLNAFSG
jgi:hypothetical protein